MADHSEIEWTDATWNIVTGCDVVSPGCANCYAMRLAGSRLKHVPSRRGLTTPSKAGPVWNGTVRFNEEWLDQPLRWSRPRRIFVCAHGDLFHHGVATDVLDKVFAIMMLAHRHIFQVLTKRSQRMREYLSNPDTPRRVALAAISLGQTLARSLSQTLARSLVNDAKLVSLRTFPAKNIWIGVSVEDQKRVEERIPDLAATPGYIRFVSVEPLLGPVVIDLSGIDWLILGGESGPGARPMRPEWAQSLRDQCLAVGTAFFLTSSSG